MKTSGFPRPRLPNSAARNDVSHQVSVDPVDDACIDVSHWEQRWNLWVSGTAIHPDHISHAPCTIRVGNDHGHAWFDVQENEIRLGRCNGAPMVNRHNPLASTAVLVQVGGVWQQGRSEESRTLWQPAQIPAEMSESHLRVGMSSAAPMPPSLRL